MDNKRGFNYNKLAGAIREAGATQKGVAEAMGLHPNTINNWCNGRSCPSFDDFMRLLRFIGYDDERLKRERMGDWWAV